MNRIKYSIIWFLDWIVDDKILRHRFYWYCNWVALSPWWDALKTEDEKLLQAYYEATLFENRNAPTRNQTDSESSA